MAAGMPVVSSKTGVAGLGVEHGRDAFIANSPQEFADYSVKLLRDKDLYMKVRSNAHKMIEDVYSWTSISQKLEKIYLALTKSKHAHRH